MLACMLQQQPVNSRSLTFKSNQEKSEQYVASKTLQGAFECSEQMVPPWWWLLAIAHFLLHRGFTTKRTDGLVCLPPSNRAVRVKSEASKSKDTNSSSSTAIAAAARGRGHCRGNSSTSRESDFSSTLYVLPSLTSRHSKGQEPSKSFQ